MGCQYVCGRLAHFLFFLRLLSSAEGNLRRHLSGHESNQQSVALRNLADLKSVLNVDTTRSNMRSGRCVTRVIPRDCGTMKPKLPLGVSDDRMVPIFPIQRNRLNRFARLSWVGLLHGGNAGLYGQSVSVQTPNLTNDFTQSRIIAPASSPMVPSIARSL